MTNPQAQMNDGRRAKKAEGMAAAIKWRESRRCREPVADAFSASGSRECRALAYESCAHRPDGLR